MQSEQYRSKEKPCPKCAELWDAFDAATKEYIDLLKEQASIAATNVKRSHLLDPLIQAAFQGRSAARSSIEFHRVLDHGKEPQNDDGGVLNRLRHRYFR
jgi:hypothetical protein